MVLAKQFFADIKIYGRTRDNWTKGRPVKRVPTFSNAYLLIVAECVDSEIFVRLPN